MVSMDEAVARINELYHLSKERELTDEEKHEQKLLRQRYIQNIKANLSVQLHNIVIDRPDGTSEPLIKPTDKK